LAARANVRVLEADAHDVSLWRGARKVSVGFAVKHVPPAWIDALAAGGMLVVPVDDGRGAQRLMRVTKDEAGAVREESLGQVRYVADRSARA
jgi:protein-L-isoaspartate O-methyltransferase